MAANRINLVRLGCAVSLLLGLAGGIVLFTRYQDLTRCQDDRPLLISMDVTSDPSQSKQLIEQFRKFAFKHSFRLDIVNPGQDDNDFRIRMLRKDVEIITRKPVTPSEFRIEFYNKDCNHPIVATDIHDLVIDLKSLIGEVPNVTITENQ